MNETRDENFFRASLLFGGIALGALAMVVVDNIRDARSDAVAARAQFDQAGGVRECDSISRSASRDSYQTGLGVSAHYQECANGIITAEIREFERVERYTFDVMNGTFVLKTDSTSAFVDSSESFGFTADNFEAGKFLDDARRYLSVGDAPAAITP